MGAQNPQGDRQTTVRVLEDHVFPTNFSMSPTSLIREPGEVVCRRRDDELLESASSGHTSIIGTKPD
jgi:hypothetical protein